MGKVNFSFRERALAEAARYGSDSWVFLRELLQNARDAGARRVELTVSEDDDGTERLRCRDDGSGMSAVHAHRYLFALYASSKEGDLRQAGQFGVGFWSVLRFHPDRVIIRSRPRGGDAWQVDLNHRLENAVFTSCTMAAGTEIILERRRVRRAPSRRTNDGSLRRSRPLAEKVFRAAWRYGRFVTRHGTESSLWNRHRHRPLRVTVNGRSVNAEMTLPAPSSSFLRGGLRGVVALGCEPRVELFANGLFVRQAACLEDLVDDPEASENDGVQSSLDLPGSLVPQVILDSSELEPLLARSDVRQTRHLERLVRLAERELEHLIERQLAAVRPQPWFLPFWSRFRGLVERLGLRRRFAAAWWLLPASLVGILFGWVLAGQTLSGGTGAPWSGSRAVHGVPGGEMSGPRHGAGGNLSDLGGRYMGPRLDPVIRGSTEFQLTYQPASRSLFLTALIVEDPSAISEREPRSAGDYPGERCPPLSADCVTIRLRADAGDLRIPLPTGHVLDPDSLRVDGRPWPVFATRIGEPLVVKAPAGAELEYRTGPARLTQPYRESPLSPVPADLAAIAERLERLPRDARVAAAEDQVARLVDYDRSPEAVRAHRDRVADGQSFAEAALAVKKGDCDIQNGLLVLLLRAAGVSARLAVGYVGQGGKVGPGLHAWVEYLDGDRRWQIADVSRRFTAAGGSRLLWITQAGGFRSGTIGAPLAEALAETGTAGEAGGGRWSPSGTWMRRYALPGSIAVAAFVLAGWTWHRRPRTEPSALRLGEADLAALLGGALQHPGLGRLPALVHGRFVPLIASRTGARRRGSPRAISLHEARRRAAAGTLFFSAGASYLARRAAERGIPVIDAGQPEGRVTSLGLGAVDLDEWSDLLDHSTSSALVRRLNEYLDSIGEPWRLTLASPLSQPLKIVDLSRLGLGRRQVLIDPRSADFGSSHLEAPCAVTAFRLLDAVAEHLDLPSSERARLLSELAGEAVLEEHGR